jgi:hypothetical protein
MIGRGGISFSHFFWQNILYDLKQFLVVRSYFKNVLLGKSLTICKSFFFAAAAELCNAVKNSLLQNPRIREILERLFEEIEIICEAIIILGDKKSCISKIKPET